jgi:hypothetical protein
VANIVYTDKIDIMVQGETLKDIVRRLDTLRRCL